MGYLILLSLVAFLIVLTLLLKKRYLPARTIKSYIYAGGNVQPRLITLGTFNTWIWTTSILGATEAGITYGLPGCVAYALGADLGFITVVILLLKFSRKPSFIFLTDLIKEKLSPTSEVFYYGICTMMVSYTVIQQAVGIANVFSMLWGMSYKLIAFFIVLISVAFVIYSGMRGVLISDLICFLFILASLVSIVAIIAGGSSSQAFVNGFLLSVSDLKANMHPSTIKSFLKGLTFYILASVIVGSSQTVLDPTYYIKANMVNDPKTLKRVLMSGGVYIWTPVVIITSTVFSSLWRTYMGRQALESFNTNLLTDVLFVRSSSLGLKIAFAAAMAVIGITTMTNAFIGIVALMTLRGHSLVTKESGDDGSKLKFGQLFTIMLALFCALIAVSLENISLFKINIVCGIFFAAPCGIVLFMRQISTKSEYLPSLAAATGIIAGVVVWTRINQYNLLFGTLVSFIAPILLMDLFRLLGKRSR